MSNTYSINNFFERTITLENITLTFLGNDVITKDTSQYMLPPMPHSHVYGEFFYCAKGHLTVHYNEESFALTEGDIAFLPPKLAHYTLPGTNSESYKMGIMIKKCNVRDCFDAYNLVSSLFSAETPLFFKRNLPISPENMNWIFKISTSDHLIYTLSAAHTLITLSERYKKQPSTLNNNKLKKRNSNLIMHLENFIGAHYYENFTADDLAAMLYISPRQLARIVNERYNAPLHKVIIKRRVESAAKLLRDTNLSVENIISTVGFSTKTSFYKAFKKEYEMTPFQYRKQQQNK